MLRIFLSYCRFQRKLPEIQTPNSMLHVLLRLCSALLFISLVGCSAPPPPPVVSAASEATPPPYLRLPLDGPISTLDPGLTQFTDAIELAEQLFLGLTDFDPKTYKVLPELATHWEVHDQGATYRFFLRKEVQWSNGEPVTAEDIVWAIRRNLRPETKSPYANLLYILKNAESYNKGELKDAEQIGVKALDAYTLEFYLKNPASYFPALAGLWVYRPLPHKAIEQYGDTWTRPDHIQTNGSYRLHQWDKGNVLILKKNPDYYAADSVAINEVHYYIVQESSLGLTLYKSGELDVLGEAYLRIPQTEMSGLQVDPKLRRDLHSAPLFCTEIYGFNTKLPPTDNPLVRKAIVAAINKELLLDFVLRSGQEPATTFTRPPIFGSVDPSQEIGIHFNPQQAQAWLAEAGYPDDKGLPNIVLVHNVSETHHAISNALRTMLNHYVNINLQVRELDFDRYTDTLYDPKDVHLFRMGWCADYPDANNFLYDGFHPEQGSNFVRWKNQRYAQITEQAQQESNEQKRQQLYQLAEIILNQDETVILPLYFSSATYLVKPRIKNWYAMAFGGQQIRNWALEQ